MHNTVIGDYLDQLKTIYYSGYATEVSYRGIIEQLIENLLPHIDAINEPKRVEVGAPDFVLTERQPDSNRPGTIRSVPLGFIEAKDLKSGILDKPDNQTQIQRYMDLGNVVHTDGLIWRFYFNRELVKELSLGHLNDRRQIVVTASVADDLEFFLRQTVSRAGRTIRTAKMLALHMADRARPIRHTIQHALQADIDDNNATDLATQYRAFKETLIHDLSVQDFADLYAETIAYGLFAARYNDDTPDTFDLTEAAQKVPQTNPFLRQFFLQIAAYEKDVRLDWVLNNFADLFSNADVRKIMNTYGKDTGMNHDPVTHFYETFLGEYDQKRRKARGVYYTPRPVVQYIVQAVDRVLREEFDLSDGLADDTTIRQTFDVAPYKKGRGTGSKTYTTEERDIPRVQILDPATGTSTFLNETVKLIADRKSEHLGGAWSDYVEKNLLPRLHGFEILMAAYSMAHMRLGLTLAETGYIPSAHAPRIGVYLTNALEAPAESEPPLLSMLGMGRTLTEESIEADKVKRDLPIMVVIGNPPYSGVSSNETAFANSLIAKYKVESGGKQKLQERKHWLNDDYVKFIALAENAIAQNNSGVLAMITNNGYLDNPTFRGMRWHLAKTFDKIYVLDLHGNAKKKEVAPNGSKDENIFDIMQGVGIIVAVKNGKKTKELAEVYHADIYGTRQNKYDSLHADINFTNIDTSAPNHLFIPRDNNRQAEYELGIDLGSLFQLGSSGVQTSRDQFVVDTSKHALKDRIEQFYDLNTSDDFIRNKYFKQGSVKYLRGDTRSWKIEKIRRQPYQTNIQKYSYRPFDIRYIDYSNQLIDWPRTDVLKNMQIKNISLIVGRQGQAVGTMPWNVVFLQEYISDLNLFYRGGGVVYPLYLIHPDGTRTTNFNLDQLDTFFVNMPHYTLEEPDDGKKIASSPDSVSPENILDYIYAILHSPSYRERYKEFLKNDFPRIPPPKNAIEFWDKAQYGKRLRKLHLIHDITPGSYPFRGEGDNVITKLNFVPDTTDSDNTGDVYINESQYFANVPKTTYNFYIGGYQPAQKWLKDRKNKVLGYQDIEHYQRIITVLVETDEIMKELG